jgi:hypothetical protein
MPRYGCGRVQRKKNLSTFLLSAVSDWRKAADCERLIGIPTTYQAGVTTED